jgi:hypothetical protein
MRILLLLVAMGLMPLSNSFAGEAVVHGLATGLATNSEIA